MFALLVYARFALLALHMMVYPKAQNGPKACHTVDDTHPAEPPCHKDPELGELWYGIFLIMGNAGCISSTVVGSLPKSLNYDLM